MNDQRQNTLKQNGGADAPKNDFSEFEEDILELKTLANALQSQNRFLFIRKIKKIEGWLKVNKANKKLMRSTRDRIEKLKSEIENSK